MLGVDAPDAYDKNRPRLFPAPPCVEPGTTSFSCTINNPAFNASAFCWSVIVDVDVEDADAAAATAAEAGAADVELLLAFGTFVVDEAVCCCGGGIEVLPPFLPAAAAAAGGSTADGGEGLLLGVVVVLLEVATTPAVEGEASLLAPQPISSTRFV